MAVMDEFKAEREAIKDRPLREKLQYFFDYYKWHAVAAVLLLIVAFSLIHNAVTAKETVLNGILLNCITYSDDEPVTALTDDFMAFCDIDPSSYEVVLNSSLFFIENDSDVESDYNTLQALMAYVSSASLDFITGGLEVMQSLAYSEYFADLSEILSEEQLSLYSSSLLYIDLAVLEEINSLEVSGEPISSIELPDCNAPETMEKPIPVFIDMSQCDYLADLYPYISEPIVFGIIVNAPHPENTLAMVDFLIE